MSKFKVGDEVIFKPGPSRTLGPSHFQRRLQEWKRSNKTFTLKSSVLWDGVLHWRVEDPNGYGVTEEELELCKLEENE